MALDSNPGGPDPGGPDLPEPEPLDTAPLPAGDGAGDAPPGSRRRAGRNLPVAIASGVALAGVFLGTLAWDDYAFLTFVAAIVVVGVLELGVAFRQRGLRPATPVAVASGLVALYGAYAVGPAAQGVGLVLLLLGTLAWTLFDRERRDAAASIGATCLMALWVPFAASFIGLLLARADGSWYVMATVALTVTADIGAYAWGSTFGRRKLAPSVSPAKSWEGLIGAVGTVLVLAGTVTATVVPGLGVARALVLGVVVVLAGTLGDLSESLVKRDLGVKDLGSIVPGHGGIMDRVDAIILTLPAAHLTLLAMGV